MLGMASGRRCLVMSLAQGFAQGVFADAEFLRCMAKIRRWRPQGLTQALHGDAEAVGRALQGGWIAMGRALALAGSAAFGSMAAEQGRVHGAVEAAEGVGVFR